MIKLSLFSAPLRDLLLPRKLIRIVIHSVLHLCLLVLIQLFQLFGFVNFYFSGCAPSHQEMSSGVRSESNALWFSLMPSINVSGNQAVKPWTLSLKCNSQYLSSCAFISIYSRVRHMCHQTGQRKCFFSSFFFLIDPAVEMNESLGESANKKGRQRRLILSVQSHHRTWECYGRPTEELTWFDQQRAQDSSNTELIKWTQITDSFQDQQLAW